MNSPLDVAAVVGSLRRESYTRALVVALAKLAIPSMRIEIVNIGVLSLYNQDDEPSPPPAWVEFRARIERAAITIALKRLRLSSKPLLELLRVF